mmetsp:Transcript_7947/g.15433  ORF Transcript_7947/g.15433 Transcript_7947/m.15433 type:complete len:100 (-) Transcript_7947:417-716(-)
MSSCNAIANTMHDKQICGAGLSTSQDQGGGRGVFSPNFSAVRVTKTPPLMAKRICGATRHPDWVLLAISDKKRNKRYTAPPMTKRISYNNNILDAPPNH